ncbi:type II secretion system F family protein [Psychrosphaera aquimarina]|uniref:Type II secretion system F family protein n=1 Tax=Psychrosphaera aquimarina TaxID=2044854 RepID=A0ABU3R162_9GAMM|nr:type II secretion system F family protein [Psychrosphaera aquimarina]MDU0113424.1 type II secretion system F family protein [Psychrosphaera aquimarina]
MFNKKRMFIYQGVNSSGQKVTGKLAAHSKRQAKEQLVVQGFTSIQLGANATFRLFNKTLSKDQISDFTRNLATLLQAGLPIVTSLEIMKKDVMHYGYRRLLSRLIGRLKMGHVLSEELAFWPTYFNEFYCQLVEAGESVGRIDESFVRLTLYLEHKQQLANKINKALMYPSAVIIVALIVVGILMVKVIPSFQDIFASFGRALPEPTMMVIAWSQMIQQYWLYIFVVALSLVFIVKLICRFYRVRLMRDAILLKLPLFGPIIIKFNYANISQTCYTLFAAGIPIHQVLQSAAKSSTNLIYKNALLEIQAHVSSGTMLHRAMEDKHLFSDTFIQLLAIGEESGKLESCLFKINKIYQSEVEYDIEKLTNLIEPTIMLLLGILVGGLVLVMYLPIFDISSSL